MPDWLDTPPEILTALSILVIICAALMWLIKAVNAIQHETKPNSGSSMKDQLVRIEQKLDGHISWHLDQHNKEN